MTTTQLGSVAVDPKPKATPRTRHNPRTDPEPRPDIVLHTLLNNMERGTANRLADELGTSKQTINNWRKGSVRMSHATISRVASSLDVDRDVFWLADSRAVLAWIIAHGGPAFPCKQPLVDASPVQ